MADVDNTQREIRRIAYALWMEQGQPEGRDREHWEKAKEIWSFRHRESLSGESEQAGQSTSSHDDRTARAKGRAHS